MPHACYHPWKDNFHTPAPTALSFLLSLLLVRYDPARTNEMMLHSGTTRLLIALIFAAGSFEQSQSFTPLSRPVVLQSNNNNNNINNNNNNYHHHYESSSTSLLEKVAHSEYSVVGEEAERETEQSSGRPAGDFFQVNQNEQVALTETDTQDDPTAATTTTTTTAPITESSSSSKRPEYGALSAGTVVQVQVGDLSLARKAWKKRRRTGSPLLVPCSVLNVDRRSMVRWNLIFLLEKFGKSQSDGIEITAPELSKKYRTFLRSSLQKQSSALGYESSQDMISELFNKKIQESYGIRLVEKKDGTLALKAPTSRTKAQNRASRAPLLQFRLPQSGDHGDDLEDTLTHTGYLRARKPDGDRDYHFLPLSAALRVSQKDDVNTGRVEEGSIHAAVVFDYDLAGDAGSPLLTLSLNPGGIRETLKIKPDRRYQPIENPRHMFQNLQVGDGPFKAKVVQMLPGRALIDMEVGRKSSLEGSTVKVFGALRYQDSVEFRSVRDNVSPNMMDFEDFEDEDYDYDEDGTEDAIESALFNFDDEEDEDGIDQDEEDDDSVADAILSLRDSKTFEPGTFEDGEEEEDISDLFEMNADGTLSYTDPETGETKIMNTSEDEEEEATLSSEEEDDDTDVDADTDADADADVDVDMSKLFEANEDGTMAFIDPESGEALEVDSDDDEFEDMMTIKNLIDKYSQPPSPKSVDYTHTDPDTRVAPRPSLVSKRLRVGEDVEVYIRSVSKQSSQFTVSTNPLVQGRKAKDLKKESDVGKKMKRLKKILGGSLQKIYDLEGQECDGVIKATSKTGEWAYVQPELDDLPVGVATLMEGAEKDLTAGDSVRVRIAGVDEERGQLAMHLLNKLSS